MKKLKVFLLLLIPVTIIAQDKNNALDDKFNVIFSQDFEHHTNAPIRYTLDLWTPDWNGDTWRDMEHRYPGWWVTTETINDSIVIDPLTGSKVMKFSFEDTTASGEVGNGPARGGDSWTMELGSEPKEVYLSYNVLLRPGWVWPQQGGKLPGLAGGTTFPHAEPGRPTYGDGFTVDVLWQWQPQGGLGWYLYHQDKPSSNPTGDNWGWFEFQPEGEGMQYEYAPHNGETFWVWDASEAKWNNITIRVVVNTFTGSTPNHDGLMEAFINGHLVQRTNGLLLLTYPDINRGVGKLFFRHFFGGGNDKPHRDEWTYFDDVFVFTYDESVEGIPRGNVLSPPGRVLELPNLHKIPAADIEIPTIPGLLDVSIIGFKNTNIPNIVLAESKVSSFGHSEFYEYGLAITKSEESITNEFIIFANQDTSVILDTERISSGLKALYVFNEGKGNQILDNSGADPPLNLEIQGLGSTDWLPGRGLKVDGSTIISSKDVPTELINSITSTNEITIEAWIRPADINQSGPARIISLSKDHLNRAVTIGHQGNPTSYNYIARLNTTSTNSNGDPTISTDFDFISLDLHQVIYTRNSNGEEKIYVNGQECYNGMRDGDFSWMGEDYYLSIANELTGERPWSGTYYLLAIYNKALDEDEIDKNFSAGLGEIRFTTNLLVEPNITYLITPFARTDQGIIHGSTEVLRPWSNTSVSPFEEDEEPFHSVDR